MTDLRIISFFVLLVFCFADKQGFEARDTYMLAQSNAMATLENVLHNAVNENVITKAKAEQLLVVCAKHTVLMKQKPGEVLEEALNIAWRYLAISNEDSDNLKQWALKKYPDTNSPVAFLTVNQISKWLETELPFIESQLRQLRKDKLMVIRIAATVMHEESVERLSKKSASQVIEALIKSSLDNNDAMTTLNKVLPESISEKLIPDVVAWEIIRTASEQNLFKKNDWIDVIVTE